MPSFLTSGSFSASKFPSIANPSSIPWRRLRFRAEEYEEIATPIALHHRHKHDPAASALAQAVMQILNEMFPALREASGDGPLDMTPFVEECARRHGAVGLQMALEYYELFEANLIASPWSHFRRVEWTDTQELAGLFKSESLETLYGTFLDQRYIDYLAKNFESIDRMNWRKFEGLTSEFFTRERYHVESARAATTTTSTRASGGLATRRTAHLSCWCSASGRRKTSGRSW